MHDIDWSSPVDLEPYEQAHKLQIQEQDSQLYTMGMYVMSAVSTAVDHAFNGKKAKSKYIEKPILAEVIEESMLTQEEIDEREMRKEILAMEQWIANDRRRGLPETKMI